MLILREHPNNISRERPNKSRPPRLVSSHPHLKCLIKNKKVGDEYRAASTSSTSQFLSLLANLSLVYAQCAQGAHQSETKYGESTLTTHFDSVHNLLSLRHVWDHNRRSLLSLRLDLPIVSRTIVWPLSCPNQRSS